MSHEGESVHVKYIVVLVKLWLQLLCVSNVYWSNFVLLGVVMRGLVPVYKPVVCILCVVVMLC